MKKEIITVMVEARKLDYVKRVDYIGNDTIKVTYQDGKTHLILL